MDWSTVKRILSTQKEHSERLNTIERTPAIGNVESLPSAGNPGRIVWNTTTGGHYVDNGATWDELSGGGGGGGVSTYASTVGDGLSATIVVTHSLGTRDVIAQVLDASTYTTIECEVTRNSTSQVTIGFARPPAVNSLRVLVTK